MFVLPALYFIINFVSDTGCLRTLIIQCVGTSGCGEAGGNLHSGDAASRLNGMC